MTCGLPVLFGLEPRRFAFFIISRPAKGVIVGPLVAFSQRQRHMHDRAGLVHGSVPGGVKFSRLRQGFYCFRRRCAVTRPRRVLRPETSRLCQSRRKAQSPGLKQVGWHPSRAAAQRRRRGGLPGGVPGDARRRCLHRARG